jgi:hypothetical protein
VIVYTRKSVSAILGFFYIEYFLPYIIEKSEFSFLSGALELSGGDLTHRYVAGNID